MELFIDPAIGEMRISAVQRRTSPSCITTCATSPYQANRTLGVLSKMFSLAEVWGLRPDGSNPCRHVKRYKERNRERFLSPEETERLGEVLREAEDEMPSAVAAFRLLLLTGCRLSEIQFLRWEYVKDDYIELPDAKTADGSSRSDPRHAPSWPAFPAKTIIPGSSPAGCRAPTSPTSRSLASHSRACRAGGRANS